MFFEGVLKVCRDAFIAVNKFLPPTRTGLAILVVFFFEAHQFIEMFRTVRNIMEGIGI
jgi:hypothetical protein